MKRQFALAGVAVFSLFILSAWADRGTNMAVPSSYSAQITWTTDKPSTSQVEYGATQEYVAVTPLDTELVTSHKVTIRDLLPGTLYHYRVKSTDAYGNPALSRDMTFVTLPEPSRSSPPVISDIEAEAVVAAGPDQPEGQAGQDRPKASGESTDMIKKEEPIQKALIERGGILLKKGQMQLEPGFTYAHVSANRISISGYTILPVLVIGEISSEEVKRDIMIETFTARYGIRNNLQAELSVPFRSQYDRVSVASPSSENTRSMTGLGDISAGIFYQCLYERGGIPDLIAGISFKSRTGKEPYNRDIGLGTGHYGIKASLVAVKSADPAILFASFGYTYNVKRNGIENYGTVKPGDTIDYSMGVAFALNYQLALSAQLQQSITQRMRLNSTSVPGSFTNVVSLKYGLTWTINKNLSCDVSASHGLTTDAPDFILEIRFPYKF